jgi:hypothetical protein
MRLRAKHWTVAVLITPGHDGYRQWDTTIIAIRAWD